MRYHWYWPFAREEELAMARATVQAGDSLVVETIDRAAAPEPGERAGVTVVRDLHEVDRSARGARWIPSRATTYVARARSRKRHWRAGGYDLYHLHYVNRYTDGFTWLPRPLVMSVHDVFPHVPRLGQRFEHGLLRRLYERPDAIVVHHAAVAEELVDRFSLNADLVHVVDYPVLTASTAPTPPPARPPTVLLFGALRPNKGLGVLGEAMALLRDHDLRLVIAGRGHADLEQLARTLQATDDRIVAEIGFIPLERKRALFHEASIVAMPYTTFSSQSAVLQDAYGYGRPVVATNVGALGRTVREDGTGFVASPNDAAGIAEGILYLMEPAAWAKAARAAEHVATVRSPERFGRQLRAVYEAVLS